MVNHYVAMFLAALAAWIFGAIYYGVLGRAWMAAQGFSAAEIEQRRKTRKVPRGPMAISFLCELFMAVVFGALLTMLQLRLADAAVTGFMLGLGLIATSVLVNNAFQGRSWILSVIDGGHWMIVAIIECVVLAVLIS
jgi:hypothetical protein